MSDVCILVEGETEARFVRDVLAPYLTDKNVQAYHLNFKGHVNFDRLDRMLSGVFGGRGRKHVSMMIDLFRIDTDWPGFEALPENASGAEKVTRIEQATAAEIQKRHPDWNVDERFIPYIQLHEFEALLFAAPAELSRVSGIGYSSIENVIQECGTPENINSGSETAPSKRLIRLSRAGRYDKTVVGVEVPKIVGIDIIRSQCPHFNEWVTRLERTA